MALKIVWTPQAEIGLQGVIHYLEEDWTVREIHQLEKNIHEFLKVISSYPKLYQATKKLNNVRKGIVDKNNYVIYRIDCDKQIIEIVNFRSTRQRPI